MMLEIVVESGYVDRLNIEYNTSYYFIDRDTLRN